MAEATNDLDTWLAGLAGDPSIFPHQLDLVNRQLLLVHLAPERVKEAAFLDQRVLGGRESGAWVPLDQALRQPVGTARAQGVIVHCGHAGSTLISRLLGEFPDSWSLREPLILQTLAAEARLMGSPFARLGRETFTALLRLSQAWLGKASQAGTRVVVKHTSLTANLAPLLAGLPEAPAVLCLWTSLEDYLATMLREAGLRTGVRIAAGEWIHDLVEALGPEAPMLSECSDAQMAALNWCASQLAFARVRARDPGRVAGVCFSDFLDEPETHLAFIADHFGISATASNLGKVLAGPWLRRYAKDPRYRFGKHRREEELRGAKARLQDEIAAGMAFAGDLWAKLPMAGAFTTPG